MGKRIAIALAIIIPVVLVALFWQPVVDAVFIAQEEPTVIASYRMQGNIDELLATLTEHGASFDRVEWVKSAGSGGGFNIVDTGDLQTVVEFHGAGIHEFQMTAIFEDPNALGTTTTKIDTLVIAVLETGDSDAPDIIIPGIDAGPDVTITEGDFASP